MAQVCSQMERLTGDLEAAAHPALDGLTQRVSCLGILPFSPSCPHLTPYLTGILTLLRIAA